MCGFVRVCVCVCERVECVCTCMRERESVCACRCVCVGGRVGWLGVSVCICMFDTTHRYTIPNSFNFIHNTASCVCVCACVCVCESLECVCVYTSTLLWCAMPLWEHVCTCVCVRVRGMKSRLPLGNI